MENLLLDIRIAARSLRRTPWFSGLAIGILTLGIGANTLIFSLLDAVLLRSLPYAEPANLVTVSMQDGDREGMRLPVDLVEAIQQRSATIQSLSIHNVGGGVLRTPEDLVEIRGQRVSPGFFELLGVPSLAGRGFRPDEGDPGAAASMVVSFEFWQSRLAGDPAVVGREVFLSGVPYTVVGVMPPEFRSYLGALTAFWTAHGDDRSRQIESQIGHEVIARMASGSTMDDVRRELAAIARDMEANERRLDVRPLKEEVVGNSAHGLALLMVAVGVLLAIACSNLAQLSLARADGRTGEFAIRKGLGASSYRLMRLALAESLLLAACGCLGGLALAHYVLPVALAFAPAEIPRISESTIDLSAAMAATALALLTGCAVGLAPSLRLARLPFAEAMKRTVSGVPVRPSSLRSALVVGQIACSAALCVLAALIGQSFLKLLPSDPGFDADAVIVKYLSLSTTLYPDARERVEKWEELAQRVERLPGVSVAALGTNVPFGGDDGFRSLQTDSEGPQSAESREIRADLRAVSPNYFGVLGMLLAQGRGFDRGDSLDSAGVAVVNRSLARKLAPEGNALGRLVRVGGAAALPEYRVVGVVADARSSGVTAEVWDEVYIPYAQSNAEYGYVIVRSPFGAANIETALNDEIRLWAPEQPTRPWVMASTIEELIRRALAGPRFSATLIGLFSGTAVFLAALGVFGMVAYSMAQRRREFGVRAALGAGPRELLVGVLRELAPLAVVGVLVGLAASMGLARWVESELYGVDPWDAPSFLAAGAVMLVISCVAAVIPAYRAAKVDPMAALRDQ